MAVDEKYKLSTYKEISVLAENSPQKIRLVMDEATNKLYVKKALPGTDNFDFYVRLASLKHKNLVTIHDVICCEGNTYVFEEYTNGQTLQALLENEGAQPENKAADYVMQICDALIYLHSQNPPIIHRDIKPENIMLSADGVIKLIDFDIAREFKQSSKRDTVFMGTKEYAAPEQYGFKQTDGRTDIYAIGVLLHELLTGELPQNNITYKGPLQKIIVKCLRLEPKQRYQSVSALKKALVNTRFNRYKKIGVCALSAILATVITIVSLPKISGYLDEPNNAQSSSSQAVTGQISDDSNLNNAPSSSSQTIVSQSSGDLYSPNSEEGLSEQVVDEQNFYDLNLAHENIYSYGADPAIILEQEAVNEAIRGITGDYYNSVVGALQEYDKSGFSDAVNKSDLIVMRTYNTDENGEIRDRLLLEISKGEKFVNINVTYYDAVLKTTFYFTTNDDKGLLSHHVFNLIIFEKLFDYPVVVCKDPVADITGIYYSKSFSQEKKIEIFEEAGEMKFSYTDIRRSEVTKETGPLFVETIHKLDDNHYWLKNYPEPRTERLIFNFCENRLIIFDTLRETWDGEYGLRERGIADDINLRGIFDKA